MRYLFFDIECADGSRAICEFGYVLCDESLNIIRKKNILINPECKFNLTGRKGQSDLKLSYPEEEYYKHKPFDDAYDNIKFLMTQKDLLVFGHSVDNDIRYLIKACNRYKLDKFDYVAYDVQKMLPVFDKQNKRYTSLDNAFIDIVPDNERSSLIDHKADDDAYKTMLVFKSMVVDLEFSVQDLLDSCQDSKISALEYWKKYKENKNERYIRKSHVNKKKRDEGQVMWGELYRKHLPLLEDSNSIGKFVTISGEMKEHHKELMNLIKLIEDNNFVAYDRTNGSDFFVTIDEKNKEEISSGLKYPYGGRIITYQEFVELCNTNK